MDNMPSVIKGHVGTPRTFFVRERNQIYSNWEFAFFRELFQNSVDAGSSGIKIGIVDRSDGTCLISFDDDGRGMSRETFSNVYFQLGETTKGNDDLRVGGFGRARILTHFSMPGYEIRTGNLIVRGSGDYYEMETCDEFTTGCKMTIHVDASADTMSSSLSTYLACSQLPCFVSVNGVQWSAWAMKRNHVTDFEFQGKIFASVYVSEVGILNRALVRVKGTTMFTERIKTPKQVVIEIVPELSRIVLTGNRDGFHEDYSTIVRAWFNGVSANPTSALRKKRNVIIQSVGRDGAYTTVNTALDETPVSPDDIRGDVYMISELDPAQTEEVFDKFHPSNRYMETCFRHWTTASSLIIPHALRFERRSAMTWATGWYFGPELAKFTLIGDVAVFCLNPIDDNGRARYDQGTESVRQILATAKHEVAHAFHLDHDEDFSGLISLLDSEKSISADEIKNRVQGQRAFDRLAQENDFRLHEKARILLRKVRDSGTISRRDCIDGIFEDEKMKVAEQQAEQQELAIQNSAEKLGWTAGSHHWSHPLFTKFYQCGYLERTGGEKGTTGKAKSAEYRLTVLGQRVLAAAEKSSSLQETD